MLTKNPWNQSTVSLLPEKLNYKNPRRFLNHLEHNRRCLVLQLVTTSLAYNVCIYSKVKHSSLPYLQRNFILKCCHDLCTMWQIMHRVHLQYLYQYMTKFKSVFFFEIIRQRSYKFLNYLQLTWGVAEKMSLYTVHNLPHRIISVASFSSLTSAVS